MPRIRVVLFRVRLSEEQGVIVKEKRSEEQRDWLCLALDVGGFQGFYWNGRFQPFLTASVSAASSLSTSGAVNLYIVLGVTPGRGGVANPASRAGADSPDLEVLGLHPCWSGSLSLIYSWSLAPVPREHSSVSQLAPEIHPIISQRSRGNNPLGLYTESFSVGSAWMRSELHELSWLMGEPGSILLPRPDLGHTNCQTG